MDLSIPPAVITELGAAYFQLTVTLGLAAVCAVLYRRYGKPYFGYWALAWIVYALRLGAIIRFLHSGDRGWLYWHQVTTGWTALVLLWAALVFSRRTPWRNAYVLVALFPPAWSYVAIYRLDNFFLAAAPAVLFLSAATAGMGWAFYRYDRAVRSPAARALAVVVALWALHHLDYPFLRARGVWNPWGYYLDVLFELGMGTGILFLVLEDLDQGLGTLTALSGELQVRREGGEGIAEAVLRRALGLKGVHGSALYLVQGDDGTFVHGAGISALWPHEPPPREAWDAVARVRASGVPEVLRGGPSERPSAMHPYTAALPVLRGDVVEGALVLVGEARDPFAALDTRFLLAFGQQVGAALENDELYRRLAARTRELERLQQRMVRQHEEERERLGRELHDETAQVLAAVNLQLGLLREVGGHELAPALDRARALVGEGIRSVRAVTRNLRPVALDDLGLVAALRALARDFEAEETLEVAYDAPDRLPPFTAEVELALYRSLQEGLSNAVRHGRCRRVDVSLTADEHGATLVVSDDGQGFTRPLDELMGGRRSGLAGLRERITSIGGTFDIGVNGAGGARLQVWVPAAAVEAPPQISPEGGNR